MIGDLGESEFASLCAKRGIDCNKATQDRRGWDFVIQWKRDFPMDHLIRAPHELFVQVKSTQGDSRSFKINAFSYKKLHETKVAAVILLLIFKNQKLTSYKVIPIRSSDVVKCLETIAKNTRKAKTKVFFSVNHNDIEPIDYNENIFPLESYISGKDIVDYCKTRDQLFHNPKGKNIVNRATITIDQKQFENFEKMQLGLYDGKIEVIESQIFDTRFDEDIDISSLGRVTEFSFSPNGHSINMEFMVENNRHPYPGLIYTAKPISTTGKIRAKCPPFDLITNVLDGKSSLNFTDDLISLAMMEGLHQILSHKGTVSCQIYSDFKSILRMDLDFHNGTTINRMNNCVSDCIHISKSFEVSPKFSLLNTYGKAEEIAQFRKVLNEKPGSIISGSVESAEIRDADIRCLIVHPLILNSIVFTILFDFPAKTINGSFQVSKYSCLKWTHKNTKEMVECYDNYCIQYKNIKNIVSNIDTPSS